MTGRAILVSLIMVLATATITARADELPEIEPGTAYALDGETLMRGEQEVGLFGIDAPEIEDMPLGPQARRALNHLLAGRRVDCAPKNKDRNGRVLAVCTVGAQDIGRLMVRQGWAITDRRFTRDYDLEERAAAAAGRGLWGAPGGHGTGFWSTVDRFQTLVAGILALIAAVVGVVALWRTTERRIEADHARERDRIDHEAKALAASIAVECNAFANACQRMVDTAPNLKTLEEQYAVARATLLLPRTTVTETKLDRISLLGHRLAASIVELYVHRSRWDRILQIAMEPDRSPKWLQDNYDGMVEALPGMVQDTAVLRNALIAFDESKDAAHDELDKAKAGPPPPT